MRLHPQITHQNGVVSVTMIASFVGDSTDAGDQTRIQAYGDPSVNLVGLMTDPADATFQFTFGATEMYVGITTQMQNYTARFMAALPVITPTYSGGSYPTPGYPAGGGSYPTPGYPAGGGSYPGYPAGGGYQMPYAGGFNQTMPGYPQGYRSPMAQGLLDCAVTDPVRAAGVWAGIIDARATAAMVVLRAETPPQLTTLPDATA